MTTAPIVETDCGLVRGVWREASGDTAGPSKTTRSAAFLGIPFAAAPTGKRRFHAPQRHKPWNGIRDATQFGATAQRGDQGETLIPEPSIPGPSILNVNVFTPALDGELPVLVWIHGGGFVVGSPASPWYDGATFNRNGVVVVTLSYRLGFDGFGVIDGAPDNRGVLDWIAGLEWVQRNIRAFGGDPNRVTIAGQSAGGGAVLTLLGMERAQHLFDNALSISGALGDIPRPRALARSRRLAEIVGCEPNLNGFRELKEKTLISKQHEAAMLGAKGFARATDVITHGLPWGPVIDGTLITRPTVESLRAGVGADKPLLLGATDDEFTMALDRARRILRFVPAWIPLLRMLPHGVTRRAYTAANRRERRKGTAVVLGRFVSDHVFRALVPRVAEARTDAPTWAYRFAWATPVNGWSHHCLDIPFWFNILDEPHVARIAGPHPPQTLADDMHATAVRFITTGEPGWDTWRSSPGLTRVYSTNPHEPALNDTAYDNALPLM